MIDWDLIARNEGFESPCEMIEELRYRLRLPDDLIAERLVVSARAVGGLRKKLGLVRPMPRVTHAELLSTAGDVSSMTVPEIAARIGISRESTRNILYHTGTPYRHRHKGGE